MTIATEKELASSSRFMFVKLTPAKFINDDLVLESASIFVATFTFNSVIRLERNGSALTRVTTPSSNDEFSYDRDTGKLTVQLADAPNEDTNVLILFFELFFTGGKSRVAARIPDAVVSETNFLVDWEPKLSSYPRTTETFKNVVAGILTISNTPITIINTDGDFQQFLELTHTFNNKDVNIWYEINDESSIEEIFTGKISALSSDDNSVTLTVYDVFNKLTDPALMGDNADEAYARRSAGGFPLLAPSENDTPIPFIMGRRSPDNISTSIEDSSECDEPSLNNIGKLFGKNTDFSERAGVTRNRNWLLCRTNTGIVTQSFGTLEAFQLASFGGSIVDHFFMRFSSISNISVGDTIKVNFDDGVAKTEYYLIAFVGDFISTTGPTTFNIMARINSIQDHPLNLGEVTSISALKSMGVRVDGEHTLFEKHYSLTETVTTNGHRLTEITFLDDWEADFPLVGRDTTEATAEIAFRVSGADITHGDAMKKLIVSSGLDVVSATFTQADTDLSANTLFSVPFFDESDYRSYQGYCQDLLKSTLGFLSPSASGRIQYNLFSSPTSGQVIDNKLYLNKSLRTNFQYKDIATSLIASNPNNEDQTAIDDGLSSTSASSNKSKFLNEVDNLETFRHLLDDISGRIDDIMSVRQARTATYSFDTSTENIDSVLGDEITLEADSINSGTVNAIVKSITKSTNKVTVKLDDLGEL